MTKKNGDMFGLPSADAKGEEDDLNYEIQQIIPADPGWRAVFHDADAKDQMRIVPLVCFALVDITAPDMEPRRAIRPMAPDDLGEIDDVGVYEDFLCLVAPGVQPKTVVEQVRKQRTETSGAEA